MTLDVNQHHADADGYDQGFIDRLDSLLWQVVRSREASRASLHSHRNSPGLAVDHSPWAGMECGDNDAGSNFSDFYCSAASRSSPRTLRSEWGLSDTSRSSPVSEPPNLPGDLLVTDNSSLKEALQPCPQQRTGSTTLSRYLKDLIPPHTLTLSKSIDENQVHAWKPGAAKRARSLVDALPGNVASGFSQPPKRRRNVEPNRLKPSLSLPHGKVSRNRPFARGPASLRRAQSLRSEVETLAGSNKENYRPIASSTAASHANGRPVLAPLQVITEDPIVDTVPTTPIAASPGLSRTLRRRVVPQRCISPVPIIAPPPPRLIPIPPRSEKSWAKLRLTRFLERERSLRNEEILSSDCMRPTTKVECMLPSTCIPGETRSSSRKAGQLDRATSQPLGVEALGNREAIEWILTVLPRFPNIASPLASLPRSCRPVDAETGSPGSETDVDVSADSTSSSHENRSCLWSRSGRYDLYDQLVSSPQTRFHAAHLFARYLNFVLGCPNSQGLLETDDSAQTSDFCDGMTLVKWDVAIGCLALSVKYHRDVLPPLHPVFASEFLCLAPHGLTYEDLEISQRDVLSALNFNLGDTPQAILDEIWQGLLMLRQALHFRGGWFIAQNEAWLRLFDAVAGVSRSWCSNGDLLYGGQATDADGTATEPDILRFPISLLTAAAIIAGLEVSLLFKYKVEDEEMRRRMDYAVRRRLRGSGPVFEFGKDVVEDKVRVKQRHSRRLVLDMWPIVEDLKLLLELNDDELVECRSWLDRVSDQRIHD